MYQKKCFLQHFTVIYCVYLIFRYNFKGVFTADEFRCKALNGRVLNS